MTTNAVTTAIEPTSDTKSNAKPFGAVLAEFGVNQECLPEYATKIDITSPTASHYTTVTNAQGGDTANDTDD